MKKKNYFVPMIVGVIIVVIMIILFIRNLQKDSKESEIIMEQIKTTYQELEENIQEYNQKRDGILGLLTTYYEEKFKNDYGNIISSLYDQERIVESISKNVVKLDDSCQGKLFKEQEVNNICSNYQEYYEQIVNIYMNDQNQVNKMIETYNETATEHLEKFSSLQVTDYIDYNKDGKYLEKVEE